MTSPIIYETFDQWFQEQGRNIWWRDDIFRLKAAFEAGRTGAIEQCASLVEGYYDHVPDQLRDAQDIVLVQMQELVASSIRKLGEDK